MIATSANHCTSVSVLLDDRYRAAIAPTTTGLISQLGGQIALSAWPTTPQTSR